jgi:hypothetical protein
MKLNIKKGAVAALVGAGLYLALGANSCNTEPSQDAVQRAADANKVQRTGDSLEQKNLERKIKLEENPTRVGYVYVFVPGDRIPVGYYVIKGKVSSSSSQLEPENVVMDDPHGDMSAGSVVVDGPQDDGTYGQGDPGVFFFLADGAMVETQLTPLYSTTPMATYLNAPVLGGK